MNTRVRLVALFFASLLIASVAGAALAGPGDDAASRAVAWLAAKQNADGGFSDGFSPNSNIGATCDAVLALTAAGQDANSLKKNGRSPLDYLAAAARGGQVAKPGEVAKMILAVVATGGNPRNFGGADWVSKLQAKSGSYGGTLYEDTLAVLALVNAGQSVPDDIVVHLLAAQTQDGAWAFTGDTAAGAGDTNTTALAVQALVAVGKKDAVGRALDYFRRTQNADAGWPYQVPSAYGTETDANSTANVLQALLAAGEPLGTWGKNGRSDPLGALIRLQDAATGAFDFQASMPGANLLATMQAVPALKGATFVRVPVLRAGNTAATPVSAPPQTLPVAGGRLPRWAALIPVIASVAAALLGWRSRREA